MIVCFRCDASAEIGAGHAMRSIALAAKLIERGHTVSFVGNYGIPFVRDELSELGCSVIEPQAWDIEWHRETLSNLGADWLIVDSYAPTRSWLERVACPPRKLMVIEDRPGMAPKMADLVLNQNIPASGSVRGASERILLGPRFALLRPLIRRLAARQVDAPPRSERRLFVMLGGADTRGWSASTADEVAAMIPDLHIDLVADERAAGINEICAKWPERVTLHRPRHDVVEMACTAIAALITAGSSTLEMCALGIPMLLLIAAENQSPIAEALHKLGAAAVLGPPGTTSNGEILQAFFQTATLNHHSRIARTVVDLNGAERVAVALERRTTR